MAALASGSGAALRAAAAAAAEAVSAGPRGCLPAASRTAAAAPSSPSIVSCSSSSPSSSSSLSTSYRRGRAALSPCSAHASNLASAAAYAASGACSAKNLRRRRQFGAGVASRNRVVRAAAAAEGKAEGETVAVVGGSGFVGSALVSRLAQEGGNVRVLTRSRDSASRALAGVKGLTFYEPAEWPKAIQGVDAVVNLAGTPISTRWSPSVKEDIINSRVNSTAKIVDAILASPAELRPKVLINSSAVGFYGVSETSVYDESSPAGDDFLAEVCIKWEEAARKVEGSGTRLVIIRNGIVLDRDGGALAKMLPIFQLFAGGPLGTGKQWMSWIHREDLVSLFIEAIRDPKYEGVINGTAPTPVRVLELCDQLGRVLGRPSWLPVPEFAVKALLGEGASVVLDGQRVLPKRAQDLGFRFKHRYVAEALGDILAASDTSKSSVNVSA